MRIRRLAPLLVLAGTLIAGPAFARCEGFVPQPKPQNSPAQDIGREFDRILDEGWIEIALYDDFAPWSYDLDGKPIGVDVDIARLIAADLGVEARIRLVDAGENLDADLMNYVWKGAAVGGHVSDLMLHVPYDSDYACRFDQVVFTGQYAMESMAIGYRLKDYPEKGPTPNYFRYDTVGVENDSIADFYLTSIGNGSVDHSIHRYRSTGAAVQAMAQGEVMAVMGPRAQIEGAIADHAEAGLAVHEPPLVGFTRGRWTIGVGLSQQHRDLGYAVDDALAKALADGRIAKIFQSHGLTFTAPER